MMSIKEKMLVGDELQTPLISFCGQKVYWGIPSGWFLSLNEAIAWIERPKRSSVLMIPNYYASSRP